MTNGNRIPQPAGPDVFDNGKSALWGLTSQPARTAAILATLAVGISAVILAVGIVRGYGAEVERVAFGVYSRSLVIRENVYSPQTARPAILSDLDRLTDAIDGADNLIAWRQARVASVSRDETGEVDLYGVHGDYRLETGLAITQGRGITPREWQGADRVCVMGSTASGRFFPDGEAVGQTLRLGGIGCEVVGVLAASQTRTSDRFDIAVIAPFTAAARYFQPPSYLAPDEVSWITVILEPGTDMHDARMTADRTLRRARGVPLSRASPYRFDDPGASRRAIERERDLLSVLVSALAVVSMAAALIGFSSVMSSTIHERRHEIATRMSLGARARIIRAQFVGEATVIGLAGGILGGIAGAGLCQIMAAFWGWEVVVDWRTFVIATGLGVICGVTCGYWPARRAAQTAPWQVLKG